MPKLVIIRFQELSKISKLENPYRNIEHDIMVIKDIIFMESYLGSPLYMKFYQREGVNESDFVFEYAWLSAKEELVPKSFRRFFETINVSIPIPHTSSVFEARAITNFIILDEHITIAQVRYKRIFMADYTAMFGIDANTRYLLINPLVLCNRVTLSLSAITMSNTSFYRHSSDIVVALPEDFIITESSVEMCADDYFHLTAEALKSVGSNNGKSQEMIEEIAIILSFACSCMSIICLLITITTYILLKPLRTLPAKLNLYLCVSLLVAQTLQQFMIDLIQYRLICIICGVLIHFSWSATLFWMSVSSSNLFRLFSPSNLSRRDLPSSLGLYTAYVIAMSTLLVVANTVHSLLGKGNLGYGGQICYISSELGLLLTFVTPVCVIVLSNMMFLAVTVWRISHAPKIKGMKSTERNNVVIYMKMSTLTGFCWIFGFLGILTQVKVFEFLFILTNASQGFFLMISFVCNKRVLGLFKHLLSK